MPRSDCKPVASPSLLLRLNRGISRGVRAVAESPWMKFTTGVVLLTSGLDEAIDTLFSDLTALELGAHHGVMLLGFVNVLSSLPDMLDGLVGTFLVDESEEEEQADDDGGSEQHVLAFDAARDEQAHRQAA